MITSLRCSACLFTNLPIDQERTPLSRATPPLPLNHQPTTHTRNPKRERMSDHTYKFGVSMSCGGCSGAVNRVLGKLDGECFAFLLLWICFGLVEGLLPANLSQIPHKMLIFSCNRSQILRSLPRNTNCHSSRRRKACLRRGTQDDQEDGQEGEHGRGGWRGSEC